MVLFPNKWTAMEIYRIENHNEIGQDLTELWQFEIEIFEIGLNFLWDPTSKIKLIIFGKLFSNLFGSLNKLIWK